MCERFRPMFEPRGVVVAGASTHPGKFGFVALHNLLRFGYEGDVFPVNRDGTDVLGRRTYRDVSEIPDGAADLVLGTRYMPGGGTEERLALEAGVPRERVVVIPDAQSGINMLQDGRIDVYALPVLSISDLLKKADDPNLEMIAPIEGTPIYCAGAGFRKQDVEFRDAYDKALQEMKASGEFAKIVEPYGFNAEAASLQTREKLCG